MIFPFKRLLFALFIIGMGTATSAQSSQKLLGEQLDEIETMTDKAAALKLLTNLTKEQNHPKTCQWGRTWLIKGNLTRQTGKVADALQGYDTGIAALQDLNCPEILGEIYVKKGITYYSLGQLQQAQEFAESSIDFAEQQGNKSLKMNMLNVLGAVLARQGRLEQAVSTHQQTLQLAEELQDVRLIAGLHINIGTTLAELEKIPEAFDYLKKGIDLAKSQETERFYINGIFNISSLYGKIGNYEAAIEALLNLLDKAEELNDGALTQKIYGNLASIYLKMGNAPKTIENYRITLSHQQFIPPTFLVGYYRGMGEAFALLNEPDSTRFYYHKSRSVSKKYDIKSSLFTAYQNLSEAFFNEAMLDSALFYLNQARGLEEDVDNPTNKVRNEMIAGKIYAQQGQFAKAERTFQKVLAEATTLNSLFLQYEIHQLLSELYTETNQYETALKHYQQHIWLRDSIQGVEQQNAILRLELDYSIDKQQLIDSLKLIEVEQEHQLEVFQIENQKSRYLLISFFSVAALLLSFFFYRLLQKKNKKLFRQKERLDRLNTTKDRIFSILSHDLQGGISNFKSVGRIIRYHHQKGNSDLIHQTANAIDQDANYLSNILKNLLKWSASYLNESPFNPELFHLRPLAEKIIETHQEQASRKRVDLKQNISDDLMIWVDKNSLEIILRNLLQNALKYTDRGGEILLTAEQEATSVNITIRDTGVGMSEEQVEKLFKSYSDKNKVGTKGEKGFGLGLLLCQELIEKNKGRILVKSELGKGTEVQLFFPRR